jgi:hypothetical protein
MNIARRDFSKAVSGFRSAAAVVIVEFAGK